jgi:uncharacterized protein YqgV (UPF0045/DUF77 family)
MKVSIDISLYPLHPDYREPIINFIENLKKSNFKIVENPLSTQIYGDYDEVMSFLKQHIKDVFYDEKLYVFVLKVIKGDRSV